MTGAASGHETICRARRLRFPNLLWGRCVLPSGHEGKHRDQYSVEPETRAVARRPRSSHGTKICPECAENVMAAAVICRFCGSRLGSPPGQVASPVRRVPLRAASPRMSGAAATAFLCSLVCIWVVSIPLGIRARRAIDRSDGLITGRGFGTAGIVIGVIDMVGTGLVIAHLAA